MLDKILVEQKSRRNLRKKFQKKVLREKKIIVRKFFAKKNRKENVLWEKLKKIVFVKTMVKKNFVKKNSKKEIFLEE